MQYEKMFFLFKRMDIVLIDVLGKIAKEFFPHRTQPQLGTPSLNETEIEFALLRLENRCNIAGMLGSLAQSKIHEGVAQRFTALEWRLDRR